MQLTMATKKIAPSRMSAAKTIFATFQILKDEGGQLAGRQVIERIRNTIKFTDWEREILEKSGYVRWVAIKDFNKAIELEPKSSWTYFKRGRAKYSLNDKEGACMDWSRAGELGDADAYNWIKDYCNN